MDISDIFLVQYIDDSRFSTLKVEEDTEIKLSTEFEFAIDSSVVMTRRGP